MTVWEGLTYIGVITGDKQKACDPPWKWNTMHIQKQYLYYAGCYHEPGQLRAKSITTAWTVRLHEAKYKR